MLYNAWTFPSALISHDSSCRAGQNQKQYCVTDDGHGPGTRVTQQFPISAVMNGIMEWFGKGP